MDLHRRLLYGSHRPRQIVGRITPIGPNFYDAAGTLVVRKSITAFCLPKRKMEGRGDEALRFLDFAAREGFNEVRFFASVDWTGPPGPGVESGWSYDEDACAWVLDQAKARGLRCEVTALTYDGGLESALDRLRRADELCLAHENALLGIFNEPQQNASGGNVRLEEILARYEPRCPSWTTGVYTPTPDTSIVQVGVDDKGRPIYAATATSRRAKSMNYHSPRKDEWSRCTKDAYEYETGSGPENQFSPRYEGAVYMGEPPQVEQTIRDAGTGAYWPDPADDWAAYGAGCAFWGCGGLIHSNPTFQQCTVPTDTQILACVRGFIRGINTVPPQRYSGYSGSLSPTPSDNPGSRRYRRWDNSGAAWEIRVRPFGFGRV